jgi:thioesterase domain-containing protein/acyl carrier protein
MGIKQTDRLSLLYSLNFSAANLDIFSGIYNGASVVLYNLKARGLSELSDWLKLEQITILHTIPTVFRHLLKHSRTCEQYSAIRAVDLGGEPVFKTDLTIIKRHFNDTCTVYNHLAATEASVIAYHKIDRSRDYQETYIPVGKAAPGIEISIHRQQKDSRAGRIYLKSQYLSPGYINNEELNKLVFEYQDGFTVYKSGDIGTIGHDGELIFIGRSDPRVKINGHTVDLSELEAALNSLPEINTAIIKTVGDIETQPQELICYAQLVDNNATGEIALRHHLLTLLPSYMVPKYFVFLENFPLTATGKIDRKSLTFTPPEFTTESRVTDEYNLISKLREIYSRNLKKHVENDNIAFFDYGGDSISLMDAIVEIEAIFNIKLPMGLVVKDSSVASLSKYILDHSSSGEKTSPNNEIVEPLTNIEKTKPNLFLIHGRNGHVYIGNHFLNLLDNHFNVYGFKARGLNYGENPGLSIQGIAADYICEIKKIQPSGSYYIAGLCAGGVIAVEIANQLHRTLNDVRPVLAIDPPIRKKQPPSATVFKQKLSQLYQSFHNPDERSLAVTTNNLSFRVLQERIRADFNKPDVTLMTYKVMMALEIALHTYISTPFKGEVIILASKERLEEKKEHGDTYIKGKLTHFCVSHTHNQSLDPKNYLFKSTLEKTLSYLTNQIPFT